ncbi:hypothetical protein ACHAW5_007943 [Stephanodiscus triporus]|uniref:Ubiquitin thioesterase OTU n=1 Tax=Stephanodiscus triporus TaxID=2934178 RepID=A0ABD3NG98_9STRA
MRRAAASPAALIIVLILAWASAVDSSIPRSSSGSIAASRPSQSFPAAGDDDPGEPYPRRPAWNASPKINQQGYLCELFRRIPGEWESAERTPPAAAPDGARNLNEPVIIRQVPGDGCCLFHAVAISLNLIQGRHLRMDDVESLRELKVMSRSLRHTAVECLRSCHKGHRKDGRSGNSVVRKKYKRLFIQGSESMATSQLLFTAAAQYGISPEEYCNLMEQDSYWGGGPEIVALCNVLERPIHVYELVASESNIDDGDGEASRGGIRVPDHLINKQFRLRRMATFGSPKYDSNVPLHILSADSRFPDITPESIRENGNHFMAIFPVNTMRKHVNITRDEFHSERKRRVRGGAASNNDDFHSGRVMSWEELNERWLSRGEWFNDFKYSAPLDGNNIDWIPVRISPMASRCSYRNLFRQRGKKNQLDERKEWEQ